MSSYSGHAQLVLPPKPAKPAKPPRVKQTKREAIPLAQIPAKGWYFESGLGAVLWGLESQCRCNALTADIGLQYVNNKGLLIGGDLLVTNTIHTTFSPTLKIGYQLVNKETLSLGRWAASIHVGPTVAGIGSTRPELQMSYRAYIYGGEINFQPRLGRYSQLRGFMALGWLTSKEYFEENSWRGPTQTKLTHSGLRLRFGLLL